MLKKTFSIIAIIIFISILIFHVNIGKIIKSIGPKAETFGNKVEKAQKSIQRTIKNKVNSIKGEIEKKIREKIKHIIQIDED